MNSAPFHQQADRLPPASMMRALPNSPSRSLRPSVETQSSQFEFGWHFPHNYPLLLVSEVAEQFNISESQVRKLADDGSIVAFHINVADAPAREHLRIHRPTCEQGIKRSLSGLVDIWRAVPDWLLPGLGARQSLNVLDVARALRITGEHVRQLHDAQKLHGSNTSVSSASLEHLRFHRNDLIAFVRARLAMKNNLSPADLNGRAIQS